MRRIPGRLGEQRSRKYRHHSVAATVGPGFCCSVDTAVVTVSHYFVFASLAQIHGVECRVQHADVRSRARPLAVLKDGSLARQARTIIL